jgi:hypothetical protein
VSVTILHRDAILGAATVRGVFVDMWFGEGDVRYMKRVREEHNALIARCPGAGALTVLEMTRLSTVADDVRKEADRRAAEIREFTSAHAIIVTSSGFVPSIIRGIIAGMGIISRVPYPYKVFDDTSKGVAWLVTTMKRALAPTSHELTAALDALRRAQPIGAI